jgi:magnesium chelatase family protein
MLAARLPSILPPLSPSELLEVSMIASVAGEIQGGALTARRPFRSPHHSASMAALTGGGMRARPGEISLAHQGVLFLDELPEFDARVLDSLRQPLENGEVSVSRANHRVTYPARFMLVAAMNPCRCGHAYEPGFACKRGRTERCTSDYQARISGPLMDRIDLRIEVPAVTAADLILPPAAEGSAEVAARVAAARDIQLKRYASAGLPHIRTNAEAPAALLETIAQPDAQGLKLLRDASETMRLSARGYHRVLRVARTLADLDGAHDIGRLHLAEALSYRALAEDVRRGAGTRPEVRAPRPTEVQAAETNSHCSLNFALTMFSRQRVKSRGLKQFAISPIHRLAGTGRVNRDSRHRHGAGFPVQVRYTSFHAAPFLACLHRSLLDDLFRRVRRCVRVHRRQQVRNFRL